MRKTGQSDAGPLRGVESSLPIALLRARDTTMRLFKPVVDEAGLTLEQWRVVRALAEGGGLDASEIAERAAILPPSVSRIIAALGDRGLLTRSKDASDARRAVIHLTDEGAALFKRVAPRSEAAYRRLEAEFGEENLKNLLIQLEALRAAARRIGD